MSGAHYYGTKHNYQFTPVRAVHAAAELAMLIEADDSSDYLHPKEVAEIRDDVRRFVDLATRLVERGAKPLPEASVHGFRILQSRYADSKS